MREIPKFQNDYNIQIRRADEKNIGNLFKSSKRVNLGRISIFKKVAQTRCTGGFWDDKSRGANLFSI